MDRFEQIPVVGGALAPAAEAAPAEVIAPAAAAEATPAEVIAPAPAAEAAPAEVIAPAAVNVPDMRCPIRHSELDIFLEYSCNPIVIFFCKTHVKYI